MLLNPKCITAHLSKLNNICQSWDHPNRLTRSPLNTSLFFVPTLVTTSVSSANLSTVLQIFTSISSIKTTNSTGPSTEPCGTPLRTISQPNTTPSINTLSPSSQPVANPPHNLTVNFIPLHLNYQLCMRYLVKHFLKVQVDNIHRYSIPWSK